MVSSTADQSVEKQEPGILSELKFSTRKKAFQKVVGSSKLIIIPSQKEYQTRLKTNLDGEDIILSSELVSVLTYPKHKTISSIMFRCLGSDETACELDESINDTILENRGIDGDVLRWKIVDDFISVSNSKNIRSNIFISLH